MTLCPYPPVVPLDGVLILGSPPMSLLNSIICFSRFLVIPFGLSFSYTLFLLRDVHFCTLLSLILLSVFLLFFISSLVEVYRSSAKSHGLFFLVFIHRILLHLGLEDFPASELVHIIAPIGATFFQQRATQMKASSKRPRVESSTGASRPPTFGEPIVEEFVDPTVAVEPPTSSSSDDSILSMLDTVMTV